MMCPSESMILIPPPTKLGLAPGPRCARRSATGLRPLYYARPPNCQTAARVVRSADIGTPGGAMGYASKPRITKWIVGVAVAASILVGCAPAPSAQRQTDAAPDQRPGPPKILRMAALRDPQGGLIFGGGGNAAAQTRWLFHVSLTAYDRSEEHTSELQSRENLVCRLLL